MSQKTGHCMCGAVSFRATDVPDHGGICHCDQCRRWTGSALVGITVPKAGLTWDGTEHIGEFQSSSWAKRGFCTRCGTSLYYQFTDGPENWMANVEVPLGLFDDPNGFELRNEIFIDQKPDSFSYAGEGRKTMTRAEVIEKAPQVGE